jgi:hypothetical protein
MVGLISIVLKEEGERGMKLRGKESDGKFIEGL